MAKHTAKTTGPAVWGGAFEAFGKAFEQVRKNPAPLLLLIAAYVVWIYLEAATIGFGRTDTAHMFKLGAVETVFYLIFLLAVPTYALALADRKRIGLSEFMRFNAGKYIAILAASVIAFFAVVGSLLLLIVPAIWVIAWLALYEFPVVDKGMGPIGALKESKRLARNHKGKVWGIIGATVLLVIISGLLSALPAVGTVIGPVAALVVTMLSTTALAILYRWLQAHAGAVQD